MQIPLTVLFLFVLSLISISGNEALSQSLPGSIPVEKPKGEMLRVAARVYDSTQLEQSKWVERSNHQLDSIQNTFNNRTDSLKSTYKYNIGKLDSLKSSLQSKLDSLTKNNISGHRIKEKLDSLTKLQSTIATRFETKLQNIKDDHVTIPTSNLKIPGLEGFDKPLKKLNDLSNVGEMNDMNATGITDQVGNVGMPKKLSDVDQIANLPGKVPDVSDVSDELNGFTYEAESLPKGEIGDVENLSKVAEEKATELSGISEIEEQAESLDQYKEIATTPPSQDSLKEMAIEQIKQVAVNHFAGKEQVLQEAMDIMTKYKNRYSSITSIADLPKKRPNEMRGKPLIERIIPGIALQIQKEGDDLMVDFNAYFAYRFTAKLNAGGGWNQRVAYNTNYNGLNSALRVYGPRLFGEYNLWKGFSPRAELEVMNTNVPAITTTDPLEREWVWGAFIGVKKEYRIIRNIKGTAMIMTRLFNPDHKSPYADVLNVRFGFEFPMKKKVEKEK